MKKIAAVVFVLFTIGLQAQEEENHDFNSWDTDGDGYISNDEFNNSWGNQDYYASWDTDHNGVISNEEWQTGTITYYGKTKDWKHNKNNNFKAWDTDKNGTLDENEFRQGSYNTWDYNHDGRISDQEYSDFGATMNKDSMMDDDMK